MPSSFPALNDALKGALAAILVAAPALFGAAVPAAAQTAPAAQNTDGRPQAQRGSATRLPRGERQQRGENRSPAAPAECSVSSRRPVLRWQAWPPRRSVPK